MSFSPSESTIFVPLTFFFFIAIPSCFSQVNAEPYYDCAGGYNCGQHIFNLTYPFWGDARPHFCGHPQFELTCHNDDNDDYATISLDDHKFRILDINQSTHLMTIARSDLWESYCVRGLSNVSLDLDLFTFNHNVGNLFIFYDCSHDLSRVLPNNFTCVFNGIESGGFYVEEALVVHEDLRIVCGVGIEVPVLRESLEELRKSNQSSELQRVLNQGFEVEYDAGNVDCPRCEGSGGICGSNSSGDLVFVCHCPDGRTVPAVCENSGFGTAILTAMVMVLGFLIYCRCTNKRYTTSSWISSSYPSSITDLEQTAALYGVQVFSYKELEKATSNFDSRRELGDGGFGTVYQGNLQDGRIVAVKRLYEHNYKRVEQFLNEVEILTRLRHQNLVSLYGCTSRHCQELLLVYEYVPNGTVADHLHGERAKPGSLLWTTRMSIAIETASALAYLHASDVIHRDVKTNNILLDNNFCVKVADFGLSRLFPTDVTHVSTAPQGTPGYVDPEYHECYHLTVKSDVYSFGVVLMELISSKPAVDITRHRHEINLSHMAISKIQNQLLHEFVDPLLGFESDYEVRRMVTDVAELAFQCLQNERDMRPSMEKVLEGLKRIKNGEFCSMRMAEEVDVPADEVVLLKSDPPTFSPDSVTEILDKKGGRKNNT
ncbi:hypothetical protein U1Q18_027752 [Sarracenia purpurea var. burkii]